jgi:hypothetical protein
MKEKIDFQFRGSYLACKHQAWLIVDDKLVWI